MNMRRTFIHSLLVVNGMALAASSIAWAEPRTEPMSCTGFPRMHGNPAIFDAPVMFELPRPIGGDHLMLFPMTGLHLTESQRDKIFEIQYAQMPAIRERLKIVGNMHKALRDLEQAPSFDAKRAKELADGGAKAMSELSTMQAEASSKIRALFTPEQRKKFDDRPGEELLVPRGGEGHPHRPRDN